ncbi:MAG: DUF1294 domain-containing protein [Lachnospiraceae bacterium]|nr:DUF1294 domain-containing protein [Lachnospiraceae bacterium]
MILVIYLIAINLLALFMYGIDKRKAKNEKYRISEMALITVAVLGGAIGAFLGMKIFHHKTRKKKFYITVPLFLILWCVFIVFCLYQNYHLVTTEYSYEVREDCESISDSGLTIVQISDLHNQFFGFKQERLLKRIEKCNPDIIIVTGDVVDGAHTCYPLAYNFFEGAVKIAPVYYVTGNHEVSLYGDRFDKFIKDIDELGVHFMDGLMEECEIGKGDKKSSILIAGAADNSNVSDYGWSDDKRLKVLLSHEPVRYEEYETTGADLVFVGDIHGGQIIIPGKGGLLSPEIEFFPELYMGEHTFGDMTMYISRGLGNSVLPVRVNNYPEVVKVEVKR